MNRACKKALPGLLLFALLLAGCTPHPLDNFNDWLKAARNGDKEGFKAGLTKRSQQFVEGVWTVSKQHPKLGLPKSFSGKLQILTPRDKVVIRGKRAEFFVKSAGQKRKVIMVLENRRWRLDLFLRQSEPLPLKTVR